MPVVSYIKLLAVALLSSGVISLLLTPLAMRAGFWLGLVDQPGGRRIHAKPTPRSGGIAVFIAFFLGIGILEYLADFLQVPVTIPFPTLDFLLVSLPVLVIGIIDDRLEIRPGYKLLGQFAVSILAWRSGLQLERILGLSLPAFLDFLATILIFVAAMNAYNLIDGMDGVAGGLGAITGVGLCGLNLLLGNTGLAAACLALTGACLGFLRYNFHPARVFLGDTGSMFIGFTLIALTFASSARSAAAVMLVVPLLTLGVPLLDSGLAVWRRSVRKLMTPGSTRLSSGDKDHLHHRLARKGLTQRRVAITLYALQAAIFGLGMLWLFFQNHRLAIFTAAFFAGSYVLLRYLATIELNDSGRLILDGIRRPRRNQLLGSLMPLADIAILGGALTLLSLLAGSDFPQLQLKALFRDAGATIIGGPLILLWAFRSYRPEWSRARAIEFFFIGVLATAGVWIGFSLSTLPYTLPLRVSLRLAILLTALSVPAMITLRAFPRLVQDLMHLHERRRARNESGGHNPRVLVYGAGNGYTLLTRAEMFDAPSHRRSYHLVGLIDDDPRLKGRTLHGHRVLGDITELAPIVHAYGITEVILTTTLIPSHMERLLEIAEQFNVRISEARFEHRTLRERNA